ncbi:DUF6314 family protein [Nocardioides jishulii]|uniref:DUF6314 domain-containing protein n=1 Tax=Nocardioides jishulii TaxID=2575440 RepID=A0A4U2YJX8_9ACTN|nr:DUF6314 family protein [Nocardioides jishulii]QCX28140.1 hypothetical protein FCL41_11865 [Nocardioides jishulii]TKI60805.1 hypothetical protein FC770_14940 [Nocardioides jishulii]
MTLVDALRDPRTLLGPWVFERVITDRLADEVIEVSGTLTLSEEQGGRVRWAEAGVMRRGSAQLEVFRTLFVVEREDGWLVTFDDGRDFHPWSPGAEVVHLCGEDTYAGLVEATGLGEPAGGAGRRWQVTWRVSGPRKDYLMVTRLTSA